eukprot:2120874-Rhodomonas_salina.2
MRGQSSCLCRRGYPGVLDCPPPLHTSHSTDLLQCNENCNRADLLVLIYLSTRVPGYPGTRVDLPVQFMRRFCWYKLVPGVVRLICAMPPVDGDHDS